MRNNGLKHNLLHFVKEPVIHCQDDAELQNQPD